MRPSLRKLLPIFSFVACQVIANTASGQAFTDGDSSETLVTGHTGGYLGHGVSFADFNQDGFDDLTFTQFEGQIIAYLGDGIGGFEPVNLGIGNTGGEPKCALWADFDNDGDEDLLVTQRLSSNKLYARMPDASLQEVPNAGGIAGTELERTFGAAVADYDKDGRLDVYLNHYHTPQTNSEENRLFQSTGGTDLSMTFQDVTELAGVGNGIKQSFQATWIDVDRDGWLDLHVVNDRLFWPDALYRNLGDGTFEDVSADWGINVGGYSMCSTFSDFDKDLDWDIVVTNGASEGNHFLVCDGSPFQGGTTNGTYLQYSNLAVEAGILLDDLAWGSIWFDSENDGWLDLFIGTGTSLYTDYPSVLNFYPNNLNGFWRNSNQGSLPLEADFDAVLTDNELTFSMAYADHNQDGAMDFVSHRMGPTARLLNGVPNSNHWLQVSLVPENGNTNAIGATVTAWRSGIGDMRAVTCGSEYMNQNSRRLHFGMGQALTMDSIVVDWPYGNRTVHLDLDADVHHVLYESAEDPTEGVIFGCTYTGACNYDELANSDDGSCDLSCFCGLGTYWEPLVQECLRICPSDINGDGAIGTTDLIEFLAGFGTECP